MKKGQVEMDLNFEKAPWFGVCPHPKATIYLDKLIQVRDELLAERNRSSELQAAADASADSVGIISAIDHVATLFELRDGAESLPKAIERGFIEAEEREADLKRRLQSRTQQLGRAQEVVAEQARMIARLQLEAQALNPPRPACGVKSSTGQFRCTKEIGHSGLHKDLENDLTFELKPGEEPPRKKFVVMLNVHVYEAGVDDSTEGFKIPFQVTASRAADAAQLLGRALASLVAAEER